MTIKQPSLITEDPWQSLKQFTDARIGLGRTGSSIPLHAVLDFKLAHARARDAVHTPLDLDAFCDQLVEKDIVCQITNSRVENRDEFLTRPDLGRRLDQASAKALTAEKKDYDIAVVVCDGLSSKAIEENGVPFILSFAEKIQKTQFSLAPIQVVKNGRVAIGDEIGQAIGAKLVVVLVGERPGLSSPNSMGVYITIRPCVGTTDESRNCISNVRNGGLSIEEGVQKTSYLVEKGFREQRTGVLLKDDMPKNYLPFNQAETLL